MGWRKRSLRQRADGRGFQGLVSSSRQVFAFWKSREQREILIEFNNWILDYLKRLDQRVDCLPDLPSRVDRVAALAVERILWGAHEQKGKRFAAIFADAVRNKDDTQTLEDAASFIRAIDELSEDDIRVLKHLYNHQKDLVLEHHSLDFNSFHQGYRMVKLLDDVATLRIHKDEFYARCSRLTGYGLALLFTSKHGTVGDPNVFTFRLTLLGRRLMDILCNVGAEKSGVG